MIFITKTVLAIDGRFKPWPGHCCVFLGKALYSLSASLYPGVQNGYQMSKFNAEGGNSVMNEHPIQGGVEKLLVASC